MKYRWVASEGQSRGGTCCIASNRSPHSLTPGMRQAQAALSRFLPLIAWRSFRRGNWTREVRVSAPDVKAFACGDGQQAVVYLLRLDTVAPNGKLDPEASAVSPRITLPMREPGTYRVVGWDTRTGAAAARFEHRHAGGAMEFTSPPLRTDLALAVQWTGLAPGIT